MGQKKKKRDFLKRFKDENVITRPEWGLRGWGKLVHWRPQSHQLNTLICTKHIHVSTIYGAINRLT